MLTFYRSKFKNRVLFNKMAEHNEADLHSHTMAVRYTHTNQYGGICGHGRAMGAERIAEVVECYTFLRGRANGGVVLVSHVATIKSQYNIVYICNINMKVTYFSFVFWYLSKIKILTMQVHTQVYVTFYFAHILT